MRQMHWIVGQLKGSWNPAGTLWQFRGLYNTEAKADAACFDRVEAQPPALEECRRANYEFKNEVMKTLAQAA